MNERTKEMILGGAIVLVVLTGVLWGALSAGVVSIPERPEPGLFVERSLFCPGVPDGADGSARLVVGALGSDEVRVELEPQDDQPRDALRGSGIFLDEQGLAPTNVVGYGGDVGAAVTQSFDGPQEGTGSSACSLRASRRWFLPFGSSARGSNELIYLYNPFPDEAVARVTFYDENGPISRASLADVPVPAGETTTVKVNRHILQQDTLAAEVSAVRGRIVSWKALFSDTEVTSGASLTLGATRPAPIWYFPSGAVGEGIEQRVSLLNPSDEEAIVSVSLIGGRGLTQPPELLEMTLPRETARDISLAEFLPRSAEGPVSVIVQSINEVGVVAERAVWYGEGDFAGLASEVGAPLPAAGWWLPPAAIDPARDSIVLLNTSEDTVSVDFEFQGPDGPVTQQGIGTTVLEPGGRAGVSLEGVENSGEVLVIARADGLIVAERLGISSASGDVAAVMGIPIHTIPLGGD